MERLDCQCHRKRCDAEEIYAPGEVWHKRISPRTGILGDIYRECVQLVGAVPDDGPLAVFATESPGVLVVSAVGAHPETVVVILFD